jgi:hypothetical protein
MVSFIAWLVALDDFRATPRDTFTAVRLLLKGRDSPAAPDTIRATRAVQTAGPAAASVTEPPHSGAVDEG